MATTTSSTAKIFLANSSTGKDDILSKLTELTGKIEKMKLNIFDVTRNKHVEFLPQLVMAESLNSQVQNLKEEMISVRTNIDTEIKAQLNRSSSEFQSLSSQLHETTVTLTVLEKMLALDKYLVNSDTAFESQKYVAITENLIAIQELLSKPVHSREDEILILKAVQIETKIQNEKLVFELNDIWRQHILWEAQESKSNEKIVNKLKIALPDENRGLLSETTRAMWKLGTLKAKLLQLGDNLLKYIIKPILTKAATLSQQTADYPYLSITIDPTNENIATPEVALLQIEVLLNYLNANLLNIVLYKSEDENESDLILMEHFGRLNADEILNVLVQECLLHSIPSNNKDLEKFDEVVALVSWFQEKMLALSFIKDDNRILKNFIENVNVLFANKKCQEILEDARKLMMSEIHNTVVISHDKPLGDMVTDETDAPAAKKARKLEMLANETQLSDNTFRLPTCHVSESVIKLIALAYETLNEAVSSSDPCAVKLFYGVRNMFELFCCVFPTYHKRRLATLPQLTAIHHNNCMYIAHHLMLLGPQFSQRLPSPIQDGAGTFVDLIQKVRSIGTGALMQQMATQRDDLLDCLSAASGFVSVSEEGNHFSAERSIKQVLYKLNHLKTVWEDILPPHIYSKAIGTLVNCVLVAIVNSITSLEDISAEGASHLHHLLCMLDEKAGPLFCTKFTEDATNEAHMKVELQRNIPKWMKFKELIFILNANLQEITDRWADGKGVLAHEFSTAEVKQLIRALFQNTDRRAAVLAKIR